MYSATWSMVINRSPITSTVATEPAGDGGGASLAVSRRRVIDAPRCRNIVRVVRVGRPGLRLGDLGPVPHPGGDRAQQPPRQVRHVRVSGMRTLPRDRGRETTGPGRVD